MSVLPVLLYAFQAVAAAPQVEVRAAHFYAIDVRGAEPVVTETSVIPHRPETSCFGWLLEVGPQKAQVTLREELRLPSRAGRWTSEPGTTVDPDGAGATTELTQDVSEGMLAHEWCISPGDPTGAHRVRVYQGDRLLREFNFTVVPEQDRTAI
jgi:hypothetical protein